ncbi:MAG: arylsulfatase [Pedobacter sp.]|uniref:arylsulfatase n=1 Tax=Pedobacter sp. TaxID=1411316 RepID=UPI0035665170
MKIRRYNVILWAVLFGYQAPLSAQSLNPAQNLKNKPNFVVILADDLGYSDIGSFGSEIETPNLDRLASQGLKMTQFYNASRCCPTRASLLTGRYPHNAGVGSMVQDLGTPAYQGYLNKSSITIAEGLKTQGYFTMMSGKWHVGSQPDQWPVARGFDRYFGLIGGTSNYFYPHQAKLPAANFFVLNNKKLENYTTEDKPKDYYLTNEFGDYALKFLDEAKTQNKPFYLHLTFNAPHFPIQALPEDIAKYRGKYKKGWDVIRAERYKKQVETGIVDAKWPISERDSLVPAWIQMRENDQDAWDVRMAVYAAMIDRLDQNVGRVLNKLKELGLDDNTVIIFLSDNGASHENNRLNQADNINAKEIKALPANNPQSYTSIEYNWANVSNTPFRSFKHWENEGGISTPFIAYYPKLIKAGSINHQAAHIVDIQATIFDLAGVKYPSSYQGKAISAADGISLKDVFAGKTWKGHDHLYWEHQGNKAMRQGKWKIVSSFPENVWRLFNIEEDRTELKDLSKVYPEKLQELILAHVNWSKKVGVEDWASLQKK